MKKVWRLSGVFLVIVLLFGLAVSSSAAGFQDTSISEGPACTVEYIGTSGTVRYTGGDGREVVENIDLRSSTAPDEPVDYEVEFGDPIRTTSYTDEDGNAVIENLYYSPGPVPAAPKSYDVEFGDPIYVLEYTDGNGNGVKEKIYFSPAPGSSGIITFLNDEEHVVYIGDGTGAGWYQSEKCFTSASEVHTIYVRAYFAWENGDVTVSDKSGWIDGLGQETAVIAESVSTGSGISETNQNYAYAEYSAKTGSVWRSEEKTCVKVSTGPN